MGKPVVCTRRALGDLPGVHGDNVWLGRSAAQLADGVCMLLDDSEACARMGAAGRRTAETTCSWEAAAHRLDGLCRELVQGSAVVDVPRMTPAGVNA